MRLRFLSAPLRFAVFAVDFLFGRNMDSEDPKQLAEVAYEQIVFQRFQYFVSVHTGLRVIGVRRRRGQETET